MSKFPSQMQDKFTIRFNDGLKDKVVESAKKNGRSINTEINMILEDVLATPSEESKRMVQNVMMDVPPLDEELTSWMRRLQRPEHQIELEMIMSIIKKLIDMHSGQKNDN